jgi:hypothetical protein
MTSVTGPYGRLVIGGLALPITRIELRMGRVRLTGTRYGPFAMTGGPVTVFGGDGIGVCQGASVESRVVGAGERLDLLVEMRIGSVDDA